jgi:putative ABC transport system permease protein
VAESACLAAVAGPAAAAFALLAVRLIVGPGLASWWWAVPVCTLVTLAGALAARLATGLGAGLQQSRATTPLWQKSWVDVLALAGSGLVYWLTARTGFSAVVNPDSNPTLSLSVYMFLAPALLWIGATLLLVRLRGRFFTRLAPARAVTRRDFLLASVARRGPAVNRGIVVVGLLLAFAVELALFSATYDQQARVDAQLTLGADVVVTGPRNLEPRVAAVSGIEATTPVDHTYAYVGPDLQDLFAITASTIRRATTLRDSYFVGASAAGVLARLRRTPDGLLVSKETITDYQVNVGDLLRLRVLDRAVGAFRIVPFHVAGVVQEFPSAPRDSFMVANLRYVESVTHDGGPNVVFARAATPPVAAAAVRRALHGTASVKDIRQQAVQTVSSITTVDLSGIAKIEEAFALALAGAALALFVAVALAERRHEFATMKALGKTTGELVSFVVAETALVLVTALVLASVLGVLLAEMLVAMLRHVFDPPPDHLALPWPYLFALLLAALAGGAVATAVGGRLLARMPLGAILREE